MNAPPNDEVDRLGTSNEDALSRSSTASWAHRRYTRDRSNRSIQISSRAFAHRSATRVCQGGAATKYSLDIVSVGIQYKRCVVFRIVLLTYTWGAVRLRAGSERLIKERVNRIAGPRPESNMEFRYWRRSRNYSELPCSASEADSLPVFGEKSRIKRCEHPLIEPATPSQVEHGQIEVVDHVEALVRSKRPSRLAFWNDPYNPGDAIKCIEYPGACAKPHGLWQFVSPKVPHLGDLVVWLPLMAAKYASSQEEH
jgi:hypothetical protein